MKVLIKSKELTKTSSSTETNIFTISVPYFEANIEPITSFKGLKCHKFTWSNTALGGFAKCKVCHIINTEVKKDE